MKKKLTKIHILGSEKAKDQDLENFNANEAYQNQSDLKPKIDALKINNDEIKFSNEAEISRIKDEIFEDLDRDYSLDELVSDFDCDFPKNATSPLYTASIIICSIFLLMAFITYGLMIIGFGAYQLLQQ